MIDSHCHPDSEEFAGEVEAVLQRAAEAGLAGLVAIAGVEFARRHQARGGLKIWATAGIHPHEAAAAGATEWAQFEEHAGDPLTIAIGEIGLDYFYDHAPRAVQQQAFERQLVRAAERGLPVSIHCRDAFSDCFRILEGHNPPARGVFHCFTGGRAEAERILGLGWYLSFSGMLTFAKAQSLREVAAWAPEDRLLIETDAPFLAPVPHRGRRNEPAWVEATAARLAELRGWTLEHTGRVTQANFFRLFARAV